jgi:hypothetical protein
VVQGSVDDLLQAQLKGRTGTTATGTMTTILLVQGKSSTGELVTNQQAVIDESFPLTTFVAIERKTRRLLSQHCDHLNSFRRFSNTRTQKSCRALRMPHSSVVKSMRMKTRLSLPHRCSVVEIAFVYLRIKPPASALEVVMMLVTITKRALVLAVDFKSEARDPWIPTISHDTEKSSSDGRNHHRHHPLVHTAKKLTCTRIPLVCMITGPTYISTRRIRMAHTNTSTKTVTGAGTMTDREGDGDQSPLVAAEALLSVYLIRTKKKTLESYESHKIDSGLIAQR